MAALDLRISELKVWSKGDIGWYTMELDYGRIIDQGPDQQRAGLLLRETGVLERRNGQWVLLSWHESFRNAGGTMPVDDRTTAAVPRTVASSVGQPVVLDLSGEWDILEVDDIYLTPTNDLLANGSFELGGTGWNLAAQASLDTNAADAHSGNTSLKLVATAGWQGTWQQPGNDREGEFELLLSEDGTQAKGVWWYSRVGAQKNIPPREHGGTYLWKRLTPLPTAQ